MWIEYWHLIKTLKPCNSEQELHRLRLKEMDKNWFRNREVNKVSSIVGDINTIETFKWKFDASLDGEATLAYLPHLRLT